LLKMSFSSSPLMGLYRMDDLDDLDDLDELVAELDDLHGDWAWGGEGLIVHDVVDVVVVVGGGGRVAGG